MREVYLDNSSTTKVSRPVADEMMRAMLEDFGNPSSLHRKGLEAQLLLEEAQRRVGLLLGCKGESVYFTSGGTEADNWAVFGGASARKRKGKRIVTTAFEHAAVLEPMAQLEKQGFEVVRIPPDHWGSIDPQAFLDAVSPDTILASFMVVNNEVGTILPYQELSAAIKKKAPYALVHCDAVQAFGKLPLKIERTSVDLMSVSGHKIHAPKGIGALYIKEKVRIDPIFYGGTQQKGMRPGTESMPLACGMGVAAELAAATIQQDLGAVQQVRNTLAERLRTMPQVQINSPENALPYILNLSVPGYKSETLLHFLEDRGVYVSSASACTGGARSHVLAAMGLDDRSIDGALRVSLDRTTTADEVLYFADQLQAGIDTVAHK